MIIRIVDGGIDIDDEAEGRQEGCVFLVRTDQIFDLHSNPPASDTIAEEIHAVGLSEWTESVGHVVNRASPTPKSQTKTEESPSQGPCLCPVCGKVCTGPKALTYHMNEHEGIEPYECDMCDFKSASKVGLD